MELWSKLENKTTNQAIQPIAMLKITKTIMHSAKRESYHREEFISY